MSLLSKHFVDFERRPSANPRPGASHSRMRGRESFQIVTLLKHEKTAPFVVGGTMFTWLASVPLPHDSESLDGPTLARLAACFTSLRDQLRTDGAGHWDPANAGGADDYALQLLDLQHEIRRFASSRDVRLSWLPMPGVTDAPPRSWFRLISGVVEALAYLSRHPAFAGPR